MPLLAVDIAKAPGNRFKQRLGIAHVIVAGKCPLCGYIGKGNHRTPLTYGIKLIGCLQDTVKAQRRNIKGLKHVLIAAFSIGNTLSHIWRHPD